MPCYYWPVWLTLIFILVYINSTGASSGFGAETARQFAAAGTHLVSAHELWSIKIIVIWILGAWCSTSWSPWSFEDRACWGMHKFYSANWSNTCANIVNQLIRFVETSKCEGSRASFGCYVSGFHWHIHEEHYACMCRNLFLLIRIEIFVHF